ncbi:ParA family protein [Thaumasiovibrio subtropicus]|uniref:ParA family protein n=1 Tax=Thaumasiovibrio subtropicus TaxID=1891207 RepID=UPI000B35C2F9|nr:ParA family protein [Thaumasiovibrio subtropicus]
MKRVIFNQKGGVGKSSIACNLAAISAQQGLKTLLIDLDVQGNASHYLGYDVAKSEQLTIADLLNQTAGWFTMATPISRFPQATNVENLSLIPSSFKLDQIENELERRYKIYKLRDAINELDKEFDCIYIDTPPNFNFYTKSALIACEKLLIPFDCDTFSKQALEILLANVSELREDHNQKLVIEGIIVNMFNSQANHPKQIVSEIELFGIPVIKPFIPSSVKMKESHYQRQPLTTFAPNHKLTQAFVAIAENLNEIKANA